MLLRSLCLFIVHKQGGSTHTNFEDRSVIVLFFFMSNHMLTFQPDGCHQSVNGKKTAVMSFICRNLRVIGRESHTINVSLTKLKVNVFFKKKNQCEVEFLF